MRPVTLSLPAVVVTQLKARARNDRVSQPEVLMDALTATHGRLDSLIESADEQPKSDGLFLRRSTPRGAAQPMATLSMRMLARNLDTIDQLVETHAAPSRSALCLIALRNYLQAGDEQ